AMGFEHCVANMFFIPGALMAGSDSAYQALVAAGKATALTADMAGMLKNLAVVTLGNIAGGAALVSGMYFWVQVKSRK
ncbi:MAG: formate/nitrite transporter family protein, partial [Duodenibacillus sp.]|nr:formate/nitrite transporter family protein [Duodenibacillus sp.]